MKRNRLNCRTRWKDWLGGWLIAMIWAGPCVAQISFNRDIRPILAENCFFCHGPDAQQRAADLRLDLRESAIDLGAIVPHDPANSALIERIRSQDDDLQMPPPSSLKQLSASQRDLLERWIAQGAPYEEHWSYIPPVRPPVPAATHPEFSRNAIDRFVQQALATQTLTPAPEATPTTLVRRLYLDLVGLPPPPELLEKIQQSGTDWNYEQLVDELLASPHFGERLASSWLDVVRYADTVGYHGDQNHNAFPYRDWVIQAFNANLPFDEFTRAQLAGDLLPNPTTEQLVATCYNRLNMMTREGGAQPQEYLAKYAADRVRTLGGAWLGSTVGCAECHDHKYDPFTTRDFYQLAAFFADIQQWGVYQDYSYTPNPDLRGWSNDHPFPPEIEVAVPYLQARRQRLMETRREQAVAALRTFVTAPSGQQTVDELLQQWRQFAQDAPELWQPLPLARLADSADYEIQAVDKVWQATGKNTNALELVASAAHPIASLRLQFFFPNPDWEGRLFPATINSRDIRLTLEVLAADGTTRRKVPVHFADANIHLPRYANGFEIQGVHQAWLLPNQAQTAQAVWVMDQPLALSSDEKLVIKLTGNQAARFTLATSSFVPLDPTTGDLSAAASTLSSGSPQPWEHDESIARSLLSHLAALRNHLIDQRQMDREIRDCRQGSWPVMVTTAREPLETRVLPRGNWQDLSGDVVQPAFPSFLTATPVVAQQSRLTRLDLANWLVAPENPLTARVQVNRWWKHFFGNGLSSVLDDLGIQGQYPSHPELLDWLAVEFRESGWNVKHIIHLIVLSHTYRQASQPTEQAQRIDPANIWLSHQTARRLEAEIVRDQALAVAGLIHLELGGPPVFPYQPEGYYKHLQFPDRDYKTQTDERQFRRSVYMHWQRTFLHPLLANFDAPSREECTAFRAEANTPQQALTLLNDPSFVRAALELGQSVLAQPLGDDSQRITWLYQRILGRQPRAAELSSLNQFLGQQREHWQSAAADTEQLLQPLLLPLLKAQQSQVSLTAAQQAELATWGSLARVLLNLHETITRY